MHTGPQTPHEQPPAVPGVLPAPALPDLALGTAAKIAATVGASRAAGTRRAETVRRRLDTGRAERLDRLSTIVLQKATALPETEGERP
ncbi:MAG: hypothetical protein GXY65_04845 [Rhodococcus sp.]|uniref:hypothetical protein n=1 Tax=Rhodococcus TaxID=1827 RepID=UPI00169DC018|nr:hypothetical protein [Rhodococcus yananensis]NLV78661.1 hypothetical protein [Rhodococcus sp. (in: high G+C Gram-positive bacteria)]